jgi:hypothetical protein
MRTADGERTTGRHARVPRRLEHHPTGRMQGSIRWPMARPVACSQGLGARAPTGPPRNDCGIRASRLGPVAL